MSRTARQAFADAERRFDDLVRNLVALRATRFRTASDPDWGDVGSLCYINDKLAEALSHYGSEGR